MASETPHLLLKILSGPHVGAELDLVEGTYIIGSDLECDIILMDTMAAPRQLRLTLETGNIILEPIEGITYLSGRPLEGKTDHVPMYAFITVGSSHMMLGEVGRPWPKVTAEEAPSLIPGKEGEIKIEAVAKQPTAGVGKPITTVIMPLIPKSLKILFYVATSILIFIVLMATNRAIQSTRISHETVLHQKLVNIQNAIYTYNKNNTINIESANGYFELTGYVETGDEIIAIQDAMYKIDSSIEVNIYSSQGIVDLVTGILNDASVFLSVKSLGKGNVEVYGYCFISERWQSAKAAIKLHVPGLQELVDHVVDGIFANKVVQEIIWQEGLSTLITLSVTPSEINASGLVGSPTYDLWKNAEHIINEKLYHSVPIIDNIKVITFANNEQQFFDIPIESINISVPGYVVFHNGSRYFEGTTLPNGYMIKEISGNGIILTQGNNEVIIKLDQL